MRQTITIAFILFLAISLIGCTQNQQSSPTTASDQDGLTTANQTSASQATEKPAFPNSTITPSPTIDPKILKQEQANSLMQEIKADISNTASDVSEIAGSLN